MKNFTSTSGCPQASDKIDSKPRGATYISPWKSRNEFEEVRNQIYSTEDLDSKVFALETLRVWKIRQGNHTPVSVLCTIAILEARIYDLRHNEGSNSTAGSELKSIYGGAFTRFINFLTENSQQSGIGRKGTMTNRVQGIGIEGFLVELRHLCAHTSVSISLDIFRQSAEYCMNWLKESYWDRELDRIQDCSREQIKRSKIPRKLSDELQYFVLLYDNATKAIHLGAKSLTEAEDYLPAAVYRQLCEHAQAINVNTLPNLVTDVTAFLLQKMKLPREHTIVEGVCDALITCVYMLEAPADKSKTFGLPQIHQELFHVLLLKGYLHTYFEKLLEICEDETLSNNKRAGASYWATQIVIGFQVLKKFKKLANDKNFPQLNKKSLAMQPGKFSKFTLMLYRQKLRVDQRNTLLFGWSPEASPWHLQISRCYLAERMARVCEYTKELLPLLVSLAEPALKSNQRGVLIDLLQKYLGECNIESPEDGCEDECDVQTTNGRNKKTLKRKLPEGGTDDTIYTVDDVRKALASEKGNEYTEKFGAWSLASSEQFDWGSSPLGELVHL